MRSDLRPSVHIMMHDNFAMLNRRRFKGEIARGEIFLVRRALQAAGCFEPMIRTSLEGIAAAAGQDVASATREEGFESLHKHVTGKLLLDVQQATYRKYKETAPEIVPPVLGFLFGNGVYFYEKGPNVRFHVPFEFAKGLRGIEDFRWSGKVVPHGPHQDSWYECPNNSIDVWIAVSRVEKGNGLSIYPDVFGTPVAREDEGGIAWGERLGSPYNFDMHPGDMLIFSGEHLHSSELNCTKSTRHVVSFRLTFGFLGETAHDYRIVRIGANPFHKLKGALWAGKVSRLKRGAAKRQADTPGGLPARREIRKTDDLAGECSAETALVAALQDDDLAFDDVVRLTQMARESVKPIGPKICIARTDGDEFVLFARHCPHQGADLGAGYVRGTSLFCPWHNLAINLRDGKTSCPAFTSMRILRRWSSNGKIAELSTDMRP